MVGCSTGCKRHGFVVQKHRFWVKPVVPEVKYRPHSAAGSSFTYRIMLAVDENRLY